MKKTEKAAKSSAVPVQPPPRLGVIGARVRERREALGVNQTSVAAAIGGSQTDLSAIENDRGQILASRLAMLCIALKTSSDYLLGFTDDPTPPRKKSP